MGNRDELLQRLRAGSAREPVLEYSTPHGDVAGSSSTGLLSSAALRTPTSAHAEDTGRRTSFFFETNGTDYSREIADLMRCGLSTLSSDIACCAVLHAHCLHRNSWRLRGPVLSVRLLQHIDKFRHPSRRMSRLHHLDACVPLTHPQNTLTPDHQEDLQTQGFQQQLALPHLASAARREQRIQLVCIADRRARRALL